MNNKLGNKLNGKCNNINPEGKLAFIFVNKGYKVKIVADKKEKDKYLFVVENTKERTVMKRERIISGVSKKDISDFGARLFMLVNNDEDNFVSVSNLIKQLDFAKAYSFV